MKNATCFKEGYNPAWVYLAIAENTTYNFVLSAKGNWLYVGGSGPENYSRIQDAINASSEGDTVFVYDDSSPYQENLIVDKAIILRGEDKDTTTIDGGSVTVLILADYVCVSGFTIMNSQWLYNIHRAGIYILSNDTVIYDNILTHVWEGIACGWFNRTIDHIYLTHNRIYNVKGPSLTFINTSNCTILSNTIHDTFGTAIDFWIASENIIVQNSIQNISDGHGIALWETNHCTIINNTIQNGEMQGICLTDTTNTDIISNMITSMNEIGISSDGTATIAGNIIDTCGEYGILASGDDYTIVRNSVCNTSIAIFLSEGRQCSITLNLIKQNENGLILVGISGSDVRQNNFLDNENAANFSSLIARPVGVFTCIGSRFEENYWGNTRFFPKIIPGAMYLTKNGQDFIRIPLFKLDMHPAQEPYDILEMN
jgi:parallel beta-helix repeat protein